MQTQLQPPLETLPTLSQPNNEEESLFQPTILSRAQNFKKMLKEKYKDLTEGEKSIIQINQFHGRT
ncbi:hypothetical protein [Candidatus Phytoplasma phoenicium]|uniref:Uncharacterized protein n=1 Tax=Candidatus Phytoplasma phoenicium TaxID=198422 RepID=A0A0L0MKY0_9MOLU|nr:hypothetical protein [Candidatus Phytoplasma phoenicium]KND62644.1 hypothetical protein AlmWB_01580 [Candidatus Phytoplasma phoenicium]